MIWPFGKKNGESDVAIIEEMNVEYMVTPNPRAIKYILPKRVKEVGFSEYRKASDGAHNALAVAIFQFKDVETVFMASNFITINFSRESFDRWNSESERGIYKEVLLEDIRHAIIKELPLHNPHYTDPDPKLEARKNLPPILQEIEAILDESIRPYIEADGGELTVVDYKENILFIEFHKACSTCPSSSGGTLDSVTYILRTKLNNPELEVKAINQEIAPESDDFFPF